MQLSELSGRQIEIVKLLHSGKTIPQAAVAMGISSGTAKNYVQAIYQKLGIDSRSELVLVYERMRRRHPEEMKK